MKATVLYTVEPSFAQDLALRTFSHSSERDGSVIQAMDRSRQRDRPLHSEDVIAFRCPERRTVTAASGERRWKESAAAIGSANISMAICDRRGRVHCRG